MYLFAKHLSWNSKITYYTYSSFETWQSFSPVSSAFFRVYLNVGKFASTISLYSGSDGLILSVPLTNVGYRIFAHLSKHSESFNSHVLPEIKIFLDKLREMLRFKSFGWDVTNIFCTHVTVLLYWTSHIFINCARTAKLQWQYNKAK